MTNEEYYSGLPSWEEILDIMTDDLIQNAIVTLHHPIIKGYELLRFSPSKGFAMFQSNKSRDVLLKVDKEGIHEISRRINPNDTTPQ